MSKQWPAKDPQEVLDNYIEWADRLTSETISTSTWSVTPSGLSTVTSDISGTLTRIRVSGGTLGVKYSLTNHITTSTGQEKEQTVSLVIKQK